jgi:hypothetical protein
MVGLLPRGSFIVLFLAAAVFLAVQYVPVYFTAWQFYDAIRQDVKFAGTGRDTLDSLRDDILLNAQEYGVSLEKGAVQIRSDGPFFVVEVQYSVPIDLRVYEHDLEFDWSLSGESFQ